MHMHKNANIDARTYLYIWTSAQNNTWWKTYKKKRAQKFTYIYTRTTTQEYTYKWTLPHAHKSKRIATQRRNTHKSA